MIQTASASASFGEGEDPWVSLVVENCEAGKGSWKAVVELDPFLFSRVLVADANYLSALKETRTGVAAWYVYGAGDLKAKGLSDEVAYQTNSDKLAADIAKLTQDYSRPASGFHLGDAAFIPANSNYFEVARQLINRHVATPEKTSLKIKIGPPEAFRVQHEEIVFDNSRLANTKFRPKAKASLLFLSHIISAKDGRRLTVHQNRAGVFSLSEEGYGMLIVSYETTRRMVSAEYGIWPDGLNDAAKEAIARQAVTNGLQWPEDMTPEILVLAYRTSRPEIQAMLRAPRQVVVQYLSAASRIGPPAEPELKEESRETEEQTIPARNKADQSITFKRIKKMKLRDQNGKIWIMEFLK